MPNSQFIMFYLVNPQHTVCNPASNLVLGCDCFAQGRIIEHILLLKEQEMRQRLQWYSGKKASLTFRNGNRRPCQLLRLDGYLRTENGRDWLCEKWQITLSKSFHICMAWSPHKRWSPNLHRDVQHLALRPTVLWVIYCKFNYRKNFKFSKRQHFQHLFAPRSQYPGNRIN